MRVLVSDSLNLIMLLSRLADKVNDFKLLVDSWSKLLPKNTILNLIASHC